MRQGSMKKLTETEKAYIAGLLDGEGCIGVFRQKIKNRTHEYNFGARVIITNSNFPVICWLKEKTGIGCAYEYNKSYKENWNKVHRWQVTSRKARTFIKTIYPYLIIKKEIANVVLKLPVHKKWEGRERTINQYQAQYKIFELAKVMNKRGA